MRLWDWKNSYYNWLVITSVMMLEKYLGIVPWRSNPIYLIYHLGEVQQYISQSWIERDAQRIFHKSCLFLVPATKKREVFKEPLRVGDTRVCGRKQKIQDHIKRRKKLVLARRRYELICKRSQKKHGHITRTIKCIKRGLQLMQLLLRDVTRSLKARKC